MRWFSRLVATLTVLGSFAFLPLVPHAPLIGRGAGPAFLGREEALPRVRLARDWTGRIQRHLIRAGIPMSPEQTGAMLQAVAESSRQHGLDPLAVLAVIQVESRFDPLAVSPRGALGLMQVAPETAREVADRLGWDPARPIDLHDPATNVRLGTAYLRTLLERFDGDLDAALAAFHAGPNRVASRLDRTGTVNLAYPARVWDAVFTMASLARV